MLPQSDSVVLPYSCQEDAGDLNRMWKKTALVVGVVDDSGEAEVVEYCHLTARTVLC
jgi:hypothetical protein